MVAELKELYSTDVEDLSNFAPAEPDNFGFPVRAIVRPRGSAGGESFDVMLCTPRWLSENYAKHEVLVGRHYLIVFEYNYERLYNFIREYCTKCHGNTWEEVATRVSRLGFWEFEDYRP